MPNTLPRVQSKPRRVLAWPRTSRRQFDRLVARARGKRVTILTARPHGAARVPARVRRVTVAEAVANVLASLGLVARKRWAFLRRPKAVPIRYR